MGIKLGKAGFSNLLRSMYQLTPLQQSILVGLMLSDGYLGKTKGFKNAHARLEFTQSFSKFEYFWSIFILFMPYCSQFPTLERRFRAGSWNLSVRFHTRSLACFSFFHSLFYPNGKKIIPLNILELLTPVALAHWIMGDGARSGRGLILCTDSFSAQDIGLLIYTLNSRYGLICTTVVSGNGHRIRISSRSMDTVREIVGPFMLPSMLYKINK